MIANAHPILAELAGHPDYEFTLIGSRFMRPVSHDAYRTDWDYMIDGSARGAKETGYKGDDTLVAEWLETVGFERVQRGGYSVDRKVVHYRWRCTEKIKASSGHERPRHADVDVVITCYGGEFERRMHTFELIRKSYPKLENMAAGTWAQLHDLIKTVIRDAEAQS